MARSYDYKVMSRQLKAIGMIPGYDLRKTLTDNQKRHIRRLWGKYNEIATSPESFFIRDVSKHTGRVARESGLASYASPSRKRAKIYVPRDYYHDLEIKKDVLILKTKGDRVTKRRQIFLTSRQKLLDRIKYLMENRPLKEYEYLQARIGNNSPFSTLYKYEDFLNYMTAWEPRDASQRHRRDELMAQISLATIEAKPSTLPTSGDRRIDERIAVPPRKRRRLSERIRRRYK